MNKGVSDSKSKNKRKKSSEKKDPKGGVSVKDEADDLFNFGGLRDRDLKKNLGCG